MKRLTRHLVRCWSSRPCSARPAGAGCGGSPARKVPIGERYRVRGGRLRRRDTDGHGQWNAEPGEPGQRRHAGVRHRQEPARGLQPGSEGRPVAARARSHHAASDRRANPRRAGERRGRPAPGHAATSRDCASCSSRSTCRARKWTRRCRRARERRHGCRPPARSWSATSPTSATAASARRCPGSWCRARWISARRWRQASRRPPCSRSPAT